ISRDYLAMVGSLTMGKCGLEVIRKYNMWPLLQLLTVRSVREDISVLILASLDYSFSQEARELLSAAVADLGVSLYTRRVALHVLRTLFRSGQQLEVWALSALLKRLH